MTQRFCQWLLYKRWGWTKEVTVAHPGKYIICLAPHTSNWDFIIGQLYMRAEGLRIGFLMKKEWFKGPLGTFFRHIGGIPVWRSQKSSMTDNLAETARKEKTFRLCITPEGTRSKNADWKRGFYIIAWKASIPILLYALDYQRKLIACTKSFVPTGDIEHEMKEIKAYFKDCIGKHPEKFTVGDEAE